MSQYNTRLKKRKHDEIKKVVEKIPEDLSSSDDDIDENGNIKMLIDYSYDENDYYDEDEEDDENDYYDEDEEDDEENNEEEDDDEIIKKDEENNLFQLIFSTGTKINNRFEVIKNKIKLSNMSLEMKEKLNQKLLTSSLDEKQFDWYNNVLDIPYGLYKPLPIDIKKDDVNKYFKDLMTTLDKSVYGLHTVKEEIVNYIAQCLTTTSPSPRVLALHGEAGVGKTKIVREGISKVLNRPMKTFSMGGIKDSSFFIGFDYTYMNSKFGAIAKSMIDSKVMNPIIFFDELDKISSGYEGEEIENLLIHITDPIQNHDFKDKYLDVFPIDLSKVIFIFSFNNIEKINPILRDRLHIINIPLPTNKEKMVIARNYVIDELLNNIGLDKKDFDITDKALEYIINKYSVNEGVRGMKRCIETILLKINTIKLLGKNIKDIKLSFSSVTVDSNGKIIIDENNVELFLKSHDILNNETKYPHFYL